MFFAKNHSLGSFVYKWLKHTKSWGLAKYFFEQSPPPGFWPFLTVFNTSTSKKIPVQTKDLKAKSTQKISERGPKKIGGNVLVKQLIFCIFLLSNIRCKFILIDKLYFNHHNMIGSWKKGFEFLMKLKRMSTNINV